MITHRRVGTVSLPVADGRLAYEREHAAAIDENWRRALLCKPTMFDGVVYFATERGFEPGIFRAPCVAGRFSMLQHWVAAGKPETGFYNVLGAAALVCADGAVLLGQMADHTANAGRVYFPGGAFDEADLVDGALDAGANIAREAAEETGLASGAISFRTGFHVLLDATRVIITRIADLPWKAPEARGIILANLAAENAPELSAIHIARDMAEVDALGADPYARVLSDWIFTHG